MQCRLTHEVYELDKDSTNDSASRAELNAYASFCTRHGKANTQTHRNGSAACILLCCVWLTKHIGLSATCTVEQTETTASKQAIHVRIHAHKQFATMWLFGMSFVCVVSMCTLRVYVYVRVHVWPSSCALSCFPLLAHRWIWTIQNNNFSICLFITKENLATFGRAVRFNSVSISFSIEIGPTTTIRVCECINVCVRARVCCHLLVFQWISCPDIDFRIV